MNEKDPLYIQLKVTLKTFEVVNSSSTFCILTFFQKSGEKSIEDQTSTSWSNLNDFEEPIE